MRVSGEVCRGHAQNNHISKRVSLKAQQVLDMVFVSVRHTDWIYLSPPIGLQMRIINDPLAEK